MYKKNKEPCKIPFGGNFTGLLVYNMSPMS